MLTFRNLVPDSALVEETIRLLHTSGGRAPATEVCANVLELPDLDEAAASSLVNELIGEDWRLRITADGVEVEVLCEDDECRALTETDFVVFDIETTGPKMPPSRSDARNCFPSAEHASTAFSLASSTRASAARMACSHATRSWSVRAMPPRILETFVPEWKSSASKNGHPSADESAAPMRVLPAPDTPMTMTIRPGPLPSRDISC
jgi:hypothetical protein